MSRALCLRVRCNTTPSLTQTRVRAPVTHATHKATAALQGDDTVWTYSHKRCTWFRYNTSCALPKRVHSILASIQSTAYQRVRRGTALATIAVYCYLMQWQLHTINTAQRGALRFQLAQPSLPILPLKVLVADSSAPLIMPSTLNTPPTMAHSCTRKWLKLLPLLTKRTVMASTS